MPKSPHVQGARGCWLTTPSSHEQGVNGKDGQSRERVWVLVTAGLVSAPCSCSAHEKRPYFPPSVSLYKIYSREKLRVELDNMKLCWSSHEGKCSSWICHSCLYEAVFSSTSYLLWAQTVIILTTRHTRLSGQPPTPSPFLQCPPTLTDDPNCPALTPFTMQACYSSWLQIGCMLPPVQLLWNVKGELTVARCIHQLSTDGCIWFLKIQNLERPETG